MLTYNLMVALLKSILYFSITMFNTSDYEQTIEDLLQFSLCKF